MKLAFFMMPLHSLKLSYKEMYDMDVEAALYADQLKFDEFWVGEHVTAKVEPVSNILQFLSALIPQTSHMKLCTGVLNLPQHHPARIAADVAIAIHNMPGFPLHTVVVKSGDVTPAVRGMVLRFTGRTAHASEPELGENPALAVADLLHACARWSAGGSRARDLQLVTPVHVRLGSVAYGVSAGDAEVHLTLRTRTSEALAALHHQVLETAAELADRDGLVLDSEVVEDFHATRNTPAVADVVARAAESAGLDVLRPDVGIPAGEDFGLFTERFPGCLVLLGAGEEHDPLHNPHYDFPDELIATGVSFYVAVVDSLLR